MSASDDDAGGRPRQAAASASDGLHGSADGLISDDNNLFDLMADGLLDLAAEGDDAELLGGGHNARNDGGGTLSATKNTATTNTTKTKGSKRRSGTGSKKKKAAATTSSVPTESFEYITTDQINRHDVLCGRGAGIVNNPGNEHFRTLVVARKDEYNAAERNSAKNAIARSLCQHVRTGVEPPGRFLKRATKEQAAKWGFAEDKAAENVWVPVDEKTMVERAMQSLREKDVKYVDKIRRGEPSSQQTKKQNGRDTRTSRAGRGIEAQGGADTCGDGGAKRGGTGSITNGIGMLAMSDHFTQQQDAAALHAARQVQVQQYGALPNHANMYAWSNGGMGVQVQPGQTMAQSYQVPLQPQLQPPPQQPNQVTTIHNPDTIAANGFGFATAAADMAGSPMDALGNSAEGSTNQSPAMSHSSGSADTFAMRSSTRGPITVKDWISAEMVRAMALHGSQVQEADRYYQLKAARLALALLEAVQLYHQNSIAFGGSTISSDTLRVSATNTGASSDDDVGSLSSASYSVVITGVTSQSPLATSTFEDDVRVDLANAGAVLYELFSGVPPFQNEEEAKLFDALASAVDVEMQDTDNSDVPSKKKRTGGASHGNGCIPLCDLGLPVAIDALVMDLMGMAKGDVSGENKPTTDFISDIQEMIEDPDRCLFDIEDETAEARFKWGQGGYRLEFSRSKLYGRDGDISLLSAIFDRTVCKGGPVEVVAVSGYSGIGKTSLVHQLRQPTIERGGFFISGKFDTLRQTRPLSAIASALNAFCEDLIARKQDPSGSFDSISASMQAAIGDGGGSDSIFELIPNLHKLILREQGQSVQRRDSVGNVQDVAQVDKNALNRFTYFFQKFFRAIADPSHPIVLFIDDLQWADAMSLDLIRSIVCESDVQSFLFVGSYRSNEVDRDHPLLPILEQIRTAGIPLLNIELANMDRNSINAMISDTLKLSPLLTRPLTDAVYSKTSGNCLFVIELLSDLHRQDLLRYSVSSRRWEWDDEAIAALDIQANVVDLMRHKLLRLGATEMWSVKVAACLGAETKASTFNLLSKGLGLGPENGLVALLQNPAKEGLLMKVGSSYRFSHDQIQQAAYSLVTVNDRPSFHLRLGRSLLNAAKPIDEVDTDVLFTCVDQLNRGLANIKHRREKLQVVSLNLQAAKRSIVSSTFLTASTYLKKCVEVLDESDWENNYSLCLEVYTALSETEYVTGNYEAMALILNEVLAKARTFYDKLRPHYTLMCATAAQNNLESAIDIGFEVLAQLGEEIKKEVDLTAVMNEVIFTKGILEMKDVEWFLNHSIMSDHLKLYAMKFLNSLSLYAFMFNGLLVPVLCCKMVQATVRHGLCKESSFAFAAYALMTCGLLGDYDKGYQHGKIAIALLEKFNAQEQLARVYYTIYSAVTVWVEPFQATLPKLLEGFNVGISSGDKESAIVCKRVFTCHSFQCGQPLEGLINDLADLTRDCKRYQQEHIGILIKPYWQCAQNLIGDLEQAKPWILKGKIQVQDDYVAVQRERGNLTAICHYSMLQLILAYVFRKYELAAEYYDKCVEADLEKNLMGKFETSTYAFFGALTAFEMLRRHPKDQKWAGTVDSTLAKMEKWASSSSWNFEHRLSFLEGEQMASAGDVVGAVGAYSKAARLAKEHGFINEEAVICERYAAFLRVSGNEASARVQYDKAYNAYMKWGALRKCMEVRKEAESLQGIRV